MRTATICGAPWPRWQRAGLNFPVVAKPDMSCNGVGVRVVRDEAQLAAYLAAFPRGAELQLQSAGHL